MTLGSSLGTRAPGNFPGYIAVRIRARTVTSSLGWLEAVNSAWWSSSHRRRRYGGDGWDDGEVDSEGEVNGAVGLVND